MTGALNRRLMDEDLARLGRSVAESGQPAAIVMLDIDHFKAYNDRNGHAAGDQVLRQVTQGIQREIRPRDNLYRFGGEEFLLVLRDATLEGATLAAERVVRAVRQLAIPHPGNERLQVVTISAGVAAVTGDGAPANDGVLFLDECPSSTGPPLRRRWSPTSPAWCRQARVAASGP